MSTSGRPDSNRRKPLRSSAVRHYSVRRVCSAAFSFPQVGCTIGIRIAALAGSPSRDQRRLTRAERLRDVRRRRLASNAAARAPSKPITTSRGLRAAPTRPGTWSACARAATGRLKPLGATRPSAASDARRPDYCCQARLSGNPPCDLRFGVDETRRRSARRARQPPPHSLRGRDDLVAVELGGVVGGGDQPPFRPACGSAAALEASNPRLNFSWPNTGSIVAWRRR